MYVFFLDHSKRPLNPIHPAVARRYLKLGIARVFKQYPFTIVLVVVAKRVAERAAGLPEVTLYASHDPKLLRPIRLKIDPGSKTTGLALVQGNKVIWGAELSHRGFNIHKSLTARRAIRRGRRNRKTRYRKPRFLNRTRPQGWLAPSLISRVHNILTWVKKLCKVCNITTISQELVRFDMQKMRNPEISGVEYQQGSLLGYELREYMLEKWKRECAYCGEKDAALEIEHIVPRCKGGSNSITNLTLACHKCNQKKGEQDIKVFLKGKPEILKKVLAGTKKSLFNAAVVNATRNELFKQLVATGLPVETGTGGMTKFNRCRQLLPKTHWLDAACVGESTPKLKVLVKKPLLIKANGHGTRQMCITDKHGFLFRHRTRQKSFFGFQTGDIVQATLPSGKFAGTHVGRLTVRATGVFELNNQKGKISPVRHKYCKLIWRVDGYSYAT